MTTNAAQGESRRRAALAPRILSGKPIADDRPENDKAPLSISVVVAASDATDRTDAGSHSPLSERPPSRAAA